MPRRSPVRLRTLLLLASMFLWSACAADSCSCNGFVEQPFPDDKYAQTIPTSGQVRITPTGLDFIEENIPAVAQQVVPGGMTFCAPATSTNGIDICHNQECSVSQPGRAGCDISLTIDDANITTVPTDTIEVAIDIGSLDESLDVTALGSDCIVTMHRTGNESLPGVVTATVPITLSIDPSSPTRDVRIEVGEIDANFDQVDFRANGVNFWDNIVCRGSNFLSNISGVKNLLFGLVEDQISVVADDVVRQYTCRACDANTPCSVGSTCAADDVCRYPDGSCVPLPLGVEGRLQLGLLMNGFTEHDEAAVDLMAKAADHASVDDGVTVGLRSGYQPDAFKRCVPVDPTQRPGFQPVPISQDLLADVRPGTSDPFMFGIGYHERAIEHLLWSTWASGALCLRFGTDSVDLLTTASLGLLLPSVKELAGGDTAQVYLKIVPQTAPEVVLGANTVTPSGDTYTIDEGLLTLDWKDVDVHAYAWAQDRWTRLFTLRTDLLLPVAIVPDGMGQIQPVLGDVEAALHNIRPIRSELIAEDPQQLIDLVPTLLGFALPSLTAAISAPVVLPEFFGFELALEQGDITSFENDTMIGVFADLAPVPAVPYTATLDTFLPEPPKVRYERRLPSGLIRPEVDLAVMALGPGLSLTGSARHEYSYRVDGGLWSFFVRSSQLTIDDPMLMLPGGHTIEVRARRVGEPRTVDRDPATVRVTVDYDTPTLTLARLPDGRLRFEADDAVARAGELRFRHRIVTPQGGAGPWSAWSAEDLLDLPGLVGPEVELARVDVEVRDPAGHVGSLSRSVQVRRQPLDEQGDRPTPRLEGHAAGCNTAGEGSGPGGLAWLLAFGLGLFFVRRRQGRRISRHTLGLVGLITAVSLSSCSCEDDASQSEALCEESCDGFCVDERCVECRGDDDCEGEATCDATGACQAAPPTCEETCQESCAEGETGSCDAEGTCVCTPPCGGACAEGEFCCLDSDSCQALPDPCVDQVCEPGFQGVVTTAPTGDPDSCAVTEGACECQPLPPLPIGWIGHYVSVDTNAGITATAAYNSTYGDLMIGLLDAQLEPSWTFVDGLPDSGPIVADPSGPRGGIRLAGDDVGSHTDIVVDDTGALHVLYRDEARGVMKYARGTSAGGEYSFALADLDVDGDTGYWPAMQLVDGTIHAVWSVDHVAASGGAPGAGFRTQIRYASFATDTPADAITLSPEVIYEAPTRNPCGEACGSSKYCFVSRAACLPRTNDCASSCPSNRQCLDGGCAAIYTPLPAGLDGQIGLFNELSRSDDGLLLVFYDDQLESAVWMRRGAEGWGMANVLGTPSGPYASGFVDADGALHLAYMDTSVSPALVYEKVDAGISEVVIDGLRDDADGWLLGDIGEDVSMVVEADGRVILVFQDASRHVLYRAVRATNGQWNVDALGDPGDPYTGAHGFYASLVQTAGTSLVAEFVIDNQLDPSQAAPAFYQP